MAPTRGERFDAAAWAPENDEAAHARPEQSDVVRKRGDEQAFDTVAKQPLHEGMGCIGMRLQPRDDAAGRRVWRERCRQPIGRQQVCGNAGAMPRNQPRLAVRAREDDTEGFNVGDRTDLGPEIGNDHEQVKSTLDAAADNRHPSRLPPPGC